MISTDPQLNPQQGRPKAQNNPHLQVYLRHNNLVKEKQRLTVIVLGHIISSELFLIQLRELRLCDNSVVHPTVYAGKAGGFSCLFFVPKNQTRSKYNGLRKKYKMYPAHLRMNFH